VTTSDDLEHERAASTVHVGFEPRCDRFDIDAWHVLHAARTVSRYRADMAIDVTDATFQTEVVDRSNTAAVVVDLWAPWCGPCRTIGPILEKVTDATNGEVVLVKVNVDENPGVSQAFDVKSIPAVYALRNGQVVDGFVGAHPEHVIEEFVANLLPSEAERTVASLLAEGSEGAYRAALELEPANEDAIVGLAEMLVARGEAEQALSFLAKIPENDRTRRVAAAARVSTQPALITDDYDARLTDLLDKVKTDDEARQQFVDILELMGPDDARTASYRKQLTTRLY
jgi:putative thioredoxin